MCKYLLLFAFTLWIAVPVLAQEEGKKDTTTAEDTWDDWDKWQDNDSDWTDDVHVDVFRIKGSPTMSINYGLANLDHNDFHGAFADPRGIELKLGYTDDEEVWQSSHILKTQLKNVFVSNITTDLSGLDSSDKGYRTNTWRFGFGRNSGYGYKFGSSALYFTSGGSLDWTRLKFYDVPIEQDARTAAYFNNSFRFGTAFEAGIRFQIIRQISLEADYERAIIFPRHMFWKWLGSAVIENAGQFLVDEFVDEILDSSPYFAPVISFLLKNGLNYGLYELRREKMNWPFNTAAPLTNDQFKFGLTFVL